MIGLDSLADLDLDGAEWMTRGLCAQVGGDEWFPDKGGNTLAAKAVCRRCPVMEQCLQYAVERFEWGIWGATSDEERQAIRRQRRRADRGQVAA